MREFHRKYLHLKNMVFIFCLLAGSIVARGQDAPQIKPTSSDDDMEVDTAANINPVVVQNKNDNKFVVFADFGGAAILTNSGGVTTTANGLTWGVSGQIAHQFKIKSKNTRLLLSAGLELRNFNGTLYTPDGIGSTEYDNLHYWYAGIPAMFQVVHVKHKIGSKNDWGYYAQAGVALGFKFDMLDVNSVQGDNSWQNVNDNYTALMLNTYLSAGVAFKTKCSTYLLGPYAGYVATNISKIDAVTLNVFSYGARLSVLLFK